MKLSRAAALGIFIASLSAGQALIPGVTGGSGGGGGAGCSPAGSAGQVLTDAGGGLCTAQASVLVTSNELTVNQTLAAGEHIARFGPAPASYNAFTQDLLTLSGTIAGILNETNHVVAFRAVNQSNGSNAAALAINGFGICTAALTVCAGTEGEVYATGNTSLTYGLGARAAVYGGTSTQATGMFVDNLEVDGASTVVTLGTGIISGPPAVTNGGTLTTYAPFFFQGRGSTDTAVLLDSSLIAGVTARTTNGTTDSPNLTLDGSAYDGTAHAVDWKQLADVTSNAGASTWILQQQVGGGGYTTRFSVTDAGVANAPGGISSGTSAPVCAVGTAGALCLKEGTAPTGESAVGILYTKTDHLWYTKLNNGSETAMCTVAAGCGNVISGTQWGLPYFDTTTHLASTAAWTANALMKGGGSGAPVISGCLIDSSNNLGCPGTFSAGVGSSVSGLITMSGATSGSAGIGVADIAGSPNRMNLPTATGAANSFMMSDGGSPQQLSWTASTGTGSVVRATSATLVTPALGTPSALVLTNATGLPSAGLAITTTSCTAPTFVTAISAGAVGTCTSPRLPIQSKSAAYTIVAADSGTMILHPTADNNARTFTIESNTTSPLTDGCITIVNQINTVTIAITTDTLVWAGAGTTGSRTLAANGIATACKTTSTSWIINGTGLT